MNEEAVNCTTSNRRSLTIRRDVYYGDGNLTAPFRQSSQDICTRIDSTSRNDETSYAPLDQVMPANWGARYPRRRNHPTRPRVRLDAIGRPSPSGSNLLLTLGAPLAIVENSGKNSPAQLAGKGDTSSGVDPTRSRAVRFDSVIKLVLVPARSDLGERTKDLWWQEEDYSQFRMGALMDGSAYGLRRNLRNRALNPLERLPVELRSIEPRLRDRAYPHPVEIAQALQRVDHPGPIRSPSIPAVKRRALSQRAQPPTPPSSPTSTSTPTASNDDDAQDSSVFFPKGEWSYVEDYDGSVGVCGLPA